jgi:serine/threonine protein kinase
MNNDFTVTLGDITSTAYAAPEVLKEKNKTSTKCDMWALGIILYHLVASNTHPFFD